VTRRYLRQLLRGWQLAAVTDTAQLMASELVANAVTAARALEGGVLVDERQPQSQPIELGVRRTGDSVIIEVTDPNPEPPVLRQADAMDEGGRGLSIIEILGSSWGYYAAAGGGKVVWCEIAVAGPCPAGLLTLPTAGYPGLGRTGPGLSGPEFQFRRDMEVRPGVTLGKITGDGAPRWFGGGFRGAARWDSRVLPAPAGPGIVACHAIKMINPMRDHHPDSVRLGRRDTRSCVRLMPVWRQIPAGAP
jgi:anti-sigma regulatory factor (Ser/Thr protein kinase)